jgi:Alpha/beta hydrolase
VTLTVADIDRWSADALHEVFLAAGARGRATLEVVGQLGSAALDYALAGAKAAVRQHDRASIRDDLNAHGIDSLAVARAASAAADGVAQLQAKLATLRHDAAELDMTIDSLANTVAPILIVDTQPIEALVAEMALQSRLDAIVTEANSTDDELAIAISAAADRPPDDRPQIRRALSAPLPADARQFNVLWNQLTPAEKDWFFGRDHSIGNRAGMPWDPPDHLGKDHYNRLHLAEIQQGLQSDIDRMGHSIAELLAGHHIDDGILYALQSQLEAARTQLGGYQAVATQLNSGSGPKHYLGLLDDFGCGAVSIGNPDTASHNAIFLPGTGQDLSRLAVSDEIASAMYAAALTAGTGLTSADVAVTTWMGYDRPMNLSQAALPGPAQRGADRLDAFENGLRASHVGRRSIDTVIGHSYGSTVLGAAASGGHHLDADNVIAVGSPGMLVERADRLSLNPGAHVYAMRAGNDIIGFSGVVTEWTLGAEPTAPGFGATRLAADPGPAGPLGLPSVDAHSSYWSDGNRALQNFGAVIAGLSPPHIVGR